MLRLIIDMGKKVGMLRLVERRIRGEYERKKSLDKIIKEGKESREMFKKKVSEEGKRIKRRERKGKKSKENLKWNERDDEREGELWRIKKDEKEREKGDDEVEEWKIKREWLGENRNLSDKGEEILRNGEIKRKVLRRVGEV